MAKKTKSLIKLISVLLLAGAGFAAYWLYINLYKPNVSFSGKNYKYIYVPTGSNYEDLLSILFSEEVIKDHASFEFMANKMELSNNIHPGKFRITNGMNNRQLINVFKYDKQEKVKLTFNSQIRNKEELIEYISDKLELEEDVLEEYLSNDLILEKEYGLDPDNILALFLPNTYELSWAISKEDFFKTVQSHFNSVWNKDRLEKLKQTGYSMPEVMILSSIVQSESGIESEQKKIAGVYINRLKKDMLLQADPTLKFANKNYDAQRLTNADKDINSPYNTYKYKGLPPGPICLVRTQAIDAVLNHSKHNYIFFCAKPDFSGYSDFSSTYEQHQKYASAYQKALDKRGIKR